MRVQALVGVGLVAALGALVSSVPALATTYGVSTATVNDYASNGGQGFPTAGSYWGATPPSVAYTDVVSNSPTTTSSRFEIKRADASVEYTDAGDIFKLNIFTNYDVGAFGTSYGDLFLTSGVDAYTSTGRYDPTGTSAHYLGDKLSNTGTKWDYVARLGNQSALNTSAYAYGLAGDNLDITTAYASGYTCSNIRCGQPVEAASVATGALSTGTFTTTSNSGGAVGSADGLYMLTFIIDDISKLASLGSSTTGYDIAFSWAMTCANDVIQGVMHFAPPTYSGPPPGPVPLPAAFPLFAFALGGLGMAGGWRKLKAAATRRVSFA